MNTRTTPLLTALIATVSATALGVLVAAILGWERQDATFLVALVALVVVSELVDFSPFPNSGVSISIAMIFAAGIFSGVPSVVVVALAIALADQLLHRVALRKAMYNAGLLIITGATFTATVDLLAKVPGDDWLGLMAPVMLGSLIAFAINLMLLALAISLETDRRPWSVAGADFAWMLPHYLILGVFALLMAAAYDRWELGGLALLLAPLSMLWLAIKHYADSVGADRAGERMPAG